MNYSANATSVVFIWCLTLLIVLFCFCRGFSVEALCIASEREALLKFKHHLTDPSHRLVSWAPHTDCCQWAGIVCNNMTGHILELHLGSLPPPTGDSRYTNDQCEAYERTRFSGDINASLLDLKHLNYLDLSGQYEAYERTRFSGDINASLLDLKHLNYLDLSGHDFGDIHIPPFIGSLTSLTYLNLSGAGFSGKIPHQIGNLSNLLYLDLKTNYMYTGSEFSGEVPRQIGNLTNLIYLDLGNADDFCDELSIENLQWLSSLSSLQYIDMTSVNLSKAYDWLEIMHKFSNLKELHLLGCSLQNQNQLPNTNFSSLVVLHLSYTMGYSSIPNWIFGLHNLVSLELWENDFGGPIPSNIQNLTLLENLHLSGNSFNSSIPNWLFSCPKLKLLNLGSNILHGTISDAIGNLTFLVELDMSYNQLEGNLPASLENLTSLIRLDMSNNKLEGNLQASLGNLTSLIILDLSYNQLEGILPVSLGSLCNLRRLAFSIDKCNQQISEIFDILLGCVSQRLESLSITKSKLLGHLTDKIGSFKSLFRLELVNNNIGGPLPKSLGELPSLEILDLRDNQFTGNAFQIIGQLSELRWLSIDHNQFQGIVNEIHLAGLTNLQILFASNNQLTLEVSSKWSPCFQLFELNMDSWNLGPNFPAWIQSQKNLSYLSIYNTGISDSIPTWLWSSFSSDVFLINLSHNHIFGELPSTSMNPISVAIVDLSSNNLSCQLPYLSSDIDHLDLSGNRFSGSITSFLCRRQDGQKSLEFLNLASNNLSGQIPDCWMRWSKLVTVKLENNFFIGQIPKSMGSLPSLKYLQLHNNKLSGRFPQFLKKSGELICLDLGENEISESIPSWIGERLVNLKILRLRSNKFYGRIPHQICILKFLQVLDLAQNNLSGHIPNCMNQMSAMMIKSNSSNSYISCDGKNDTGYCMVTMLVWLKGTEFEYSNILGLVTSIDLSDNKLFGEIPIEITSLSQLLSLNLSANVLEGRIPETIGNMGSLESIDFSKNQLSGEIPESMSKLNFLSRLDLSYNNLKGRIPTGTQLQTFDAVNFAYNDLSGPPLLINCSSPGIILNMDGRDKKGNGHEINWFFVSVAFGFIVGFWGFVGPLFFIRSWRFAYYGWLDNMWCKIRYCWW